MISRQTEAFVNVQYGEKCLNFAGVATNKT